MIIVHTLLYGDVFNTYSMKTYVLLYFEHKNDVIIIVKLLYRARSRRTSVFMEQVFYNIPDECRKNGAACHNT